MHKEIKININGIVFTTIMFTRNYFVNLVYRNMPILYDIHTEGFKCDDYKYDYWLDICIKVKCNIKQAMLISILPEIYCKDKIWKDELIIKREKYISYIERTILASQIEQLSEQEIREKILDAINLIENQG